MIRHCSIVVGLLAGACLTTHPSAAAEILPPDTTMKLQAFALATNNMPANPSGTNKMILLIISDTNSCTACRSLEFGILPTKAVSDFLAESFVYWACGPEVNCKEYTDYTGNSAVALPTTFIINPYSAPRMAVYSSTGADAANTYYQWLSSSLLKATAPRVTGMNFTTSNTVVVSGQSISTNVALRTIRYKVNNGSWASLSVPAGTFGSAFQLPPLTLTGAQNKLYVYGLDSSGSYKTRTNIVDLVPGTQAPAGAVAVSLSSTLAPQGGSVQFTHTLTNISAPQSFQWKKDGANVAGAMSGALSLTNVSTENAGAYQLAVTVAGSTYTGSPVNLWVSGTPQISKASGQVSISVALHGPATTNAYLEATSDLSSPSWQRVNGSSLTPAAGSLGILEATEPSTGQSRFYRPVVKSN